MPKGVILTAKEQEERREEIIRSALKLVEKKGFQKTSMREIAELSHMGKSTLYDFFKTKDEIIVNGYEEAMEAVIHKSQVIMKKEASPELCLRKILLNHLRFTKQYKNVLMWLGAEITHLEIEYQKKLEAKRHAYRSHVCQVLEKGIAEGVFRKMNVSLATDLLINSMLSLAYTSSSPSDMEQMTDEMIQIFLLGIMKKAG